MPQDQIFKADPGHIADFGKRSASDIFNEVILPTVNSVLGLLPPPDEQFPDMEADQAPSFRPDQAFTRPDDSDPLAQMYRDKPQTA